METALRHSPLRSVLVLLTGTPEDARVLDASRALFDRYGIPSRVLEVPVRAQVGAPQDSRGRLIVRQRDPVEAVVEVAQECGSDLVVAAEAGLRTQRLLRRCPCSLLIVPGDAPSSNGPVLALVDFSGSSFKAARWACTLGRLDGRPVELLHMFPIPWKSAKETRPEAVRSMDAFARRLEGLGAEFTRRVELAAVGGYVTASIL